MATRNEFLLGTLEQIVLLAAMRLGDRAYGMTVRDEIEKRTGRAVSLGAVYVTLQRLEDKGLVSSRFGEPTAERGGRSKRYYRITDAGRDEHARLAAELGPRLDRIARSIGAIRAEVLG